MTDGAFRWDDRTVDARRARRLLGVSEDADPDEIRAAYRRLIRAHHPDGGRGPADVARRTRRTAELTEAYATLRDDPRDAVVVASAAGGVLYAPTVRRDAAVLQVALPPPEALGVLFEVAHELGEVSYLDRTDGVLEVIVTHGPGLVSSLLILTEPDGTGTRAEFGTEPLGVHPPAPPGPLAERALLLLTRRGPGPREVR